ncbi:GNAT family N-acetyltransferase [uncultured Microbacterium sp.]|uniref:GNAT family N-acetyltransferase n=1 Tax=uncultured Microbacterium sp. TaxID=191216 RepID=UPI0028DBC2C3|nr:GNAT family N-acetyltransferase [uncultured Microbacterium sp.]
MIRRAELAGTDAGAVARLVAEYLRQTEKEKVARGVAAPTVGLPAAYAAEVNDPLIAYADCSVWGAEIAGEVVGVVVLREVEGEWEIKRLWAAPDVRGRGVGSALLDAAVVAAGGRVRLSVWQWRTDAIRLYESRGFTPVPSWDARPSLVCMRLHP